MYIYRITDDSGLNRVFNTEIGARQAAKIAFKRENGPIRIDRVDIGKIHSGLICAIINGETYATSYEVLDYYSPKNLWL